MTAALTPEQITEVEYISGVTAGGVVSSTSFQTWNHDSPATYSTTQSYAAKWGTPTAGTPGTVAYAFDPASNWTASEQAAFTATMHLWSAEAGITFAPAVGAANFTITRGSDGSAEGGITRLYLGTEGTTQLGQATKGELTIDTSVPGFGPVGGSFSNYGGYPWTTLLHEEGHVLGLGHSGAYDEGVTTDTTQLTSYDSRAWSLMSYVDSDDPAVEAAASTPAGGFHWGVSAGDNGHRYYDTPTTPMPLDILAAQRLYGAPSSTPLSGGQTFGFNCNVAGDIEPFFDFTKNTRPVVTLWDAGGGNTLDLSGFSWGSAVNLNAGSFSSCNTLTNNLAIAYGTVIDTAVTGSGGDLVLANSDGDTIRSGAGDDTIFGGLGHDLLSGESGNDMLVSGAGVETIYGGDGNDIIDDHAANNFNYLSGDGGDDTIRTGSGFVTALGGLGNDNIVGGSGAGPGSVQYLYGNQGSDTISYGGAGSVQIYGGQDGDLLSISTGGQGQQHLAFGNLGNDVLTGSGGYNSLYGGQGDDLITAGTDPVGHNYLTGDIGNDILTSSSGGFDSMHGGAGADEVILTRHPSNAGDTVQIGVGDSMATPEEANLDRISGFDFASDRVVISGHAAGTVSNVTIYADGAANASEAAAFASAYLYAYGDGTAAHVSHVASSEYLAVSESYGGSSAVYLFTTDHTAVAFIGAMASSFQAGAIIGG